MSVESVFKSTDPTVVTEYLRFMDDAQAQRDYAKALSERFGGREVLRRGGWAGLTIAGLRALDEDKAHRAPRSRDDLPGLRLGAKEGYWVPDKRTAEGRALVKEWAEIRAKRPEFKGMPDEVWAESGGFQSYIYHPGSTMIEDAVYVTWGCGSDRLIEGPADVGRKGHAADRVDLDVWDHVRLSEWHALQEARETAGADA